MLQRGKECFVDAKTLVTKNRTRSTWLLGVLEKECRLEGELASWKYICLGIFQRELEAFSKNVAHICWENQYIELGNKWWKNWTA